MFKNMKLGTKILCGFGLLVLIASGIGGMGWYSLGSVLKTAGLTEQGQSSVVALEQCAKLRRDFETRGFKKNANEEKDVADQWRAAYKVLVVDLQGLKDADGMTAKDREAVSGVLSAATVYERVFEDKLVAARKARDEAFADWTRIGGSVTGQLVKVASDVIAPALAKAEESKELAEITKWSKIDRELSGHVTQDFLLMRVAAVYLIKTEADEQWTAFEKQLGEANEAAAKWGTLVKGDATLEEVATKIVGYLAEYRQAGEKYHQGMLLNRQAGSDMAAAAGQVVSGLKQVDQALSDAMQSTASTANSLVIGMVLGGVIFGMALGLLITRSIVGPVRRVIEGLTLGAEQTAAAAGQVSGASQSLAQGSSEQASSLEETSSSLEEMASMTKQNAANAKQAASLASETLEASNRGSESVHRMSEAISKIKQSSDETARIIKVIDEIAFQTNLLALNAAVEAARAGEAGKGFAVVAEEVRNLAQRSAEAAKNTANLIDESQKNADHGVKVTDDVTGALTDIGGSIKKVTDLMGEVSAASEEQSRGVEQINVAVGQMDQVTQRVAASAEESASASEELSAQAEQLNGMVAELLQIVGGSSVTTNSSARNRAAKGQSGHARTATPITPTNSSARGHEAKATRASAAAAPSAERRAASQESASAIPMDEKEEAVLSRF